MVPISGGRTKSFAKPCAAARYRSSSVASSFSRVRDTGSFSA